MCFCLLVLPGLFDQELQNPNEKPAHAPLASRASVDIQPKSDTNVKVKEVEEATENLEGTHPIV